MSRFDQLTMGLAVAGIALEIVLHLIPRRWIEMHKTAVDFGLNFGFVLLGTACFMLLTLVFPVEWGQTMAPRIVAIVGAVLFIGALIWQFWGAGSDLAKAQTSVTPGCSNSVGGNMTGTQTNNCVFNVAPQRLIFSEEVARAVIEKLPNRKPLIVNGVGSDADWAVAKSYAEFFASSGYEVTLSLTGVKSPPPSGKISISVGPDSNIIMIAPSIP